MTEHPDLTFCREALNSSGAVLTQVSRDCGISRRQLQNLRDGDTKAPRIDTLTTLVNYFKAQGKKQTRKAA